MTRRDLLARGMSAPAGVLAAPLLNLGRCRLFAAGVHEYSTRAVDLVRRSLVIDMLGLLTMDWTKLGKWHRRPSSFQPEDFQALRQSGINVFHPAVDLNTSDPQPDTRIWLQQWSYFLSSRPEHFTAVLTRGDLESAWKEQKIGVLLGMQNSDHFRSLEDVSSFYGMGQRLSQLTYNTGNHLGSGCMDREDRGLSNLGAAVVRQMNAAGMIIDVSHASERTCADACAASSKPILITHANCKALVPHPRCKSDAVIRKMAATGGVMGITGLIPFVTTSNAAGIDDAVRHFDHVARLVGVEHVGIGSDTDLGIRDADEPGRAVRNQPDVPGLNHPLRVFALTEALIRRRYSDTAIEAILGGNFRRAITANFS